MKSILVALLLAVTLLAQSGTVYLPTPAETSQAKILYGKVTAAREAMDAANTALDNFKASVAAAHGLKKGVTVNFNSEFTTFSIESNLSLTSGYCMACRGAICGPDGTYLTSH